MCDDALEEFSRSMCAHYGVDYTVPAARPKLVAVTADNAVQFTPSPKKRGRKPKVEIRGNVVAFRPRRPAARAPAAAVEDATQARMSEIMAPFLAFLDRKAAQREARLRTQQAPSLPPPPRDAVLDAEVRSTAMVNLLRDLRNSENHGVPMRMKFQDHLAVAWRERGYSAPRSQGGNHD